MRKIRTVLAFMAIAVAFMACSKKESPGEGEPVNPPVTTTDKVYDLTGLQYTSYTGLVMAGYQGWFAAEGDESHRGWYHYQGNGGFFRETPMLIFGRILPITPNVISRHLSLPMALMLTCTAHMTKKA
jgi:hypothetical protein